MNIKVEIKGLERLNGAVADVGKRARYAIAQGLNDAAKQDVKPAIVRRLQAAFTIRRKPFAESFPKIKPFATPASLAVTIVGEPLGGQARADIFGKFERGGTKKPMGRSIAVPEIAAKRGSTGVLAKSQRPKALDFKPMAGSANVLLGKSRTVLIRTGSGKGIILQRTGRGRAGKRGRRRLFSDIGTRKVRDANLRPLFGLAPAARINDRLHFEDTARLVAQTAATKRIGARIAEAVRYANRGAR
jgi:hypothetical protein